MIAYFQENSQKLTQVLVEHMELAGISLFVALLLAIAMTLFLYFQPALSRASVYALSLLYAIPSFAFFALLIPVTGLGRTTAIVVLVLYAQYILVRNFLAGLDQVDQTCVEVAKAMGMTPWQVLVKVQLSLAKPSFFAGIRLAGNAIIAMGTIAATINAGGLGTILFDGLRTMSLVKLGWGILLTVAVSLLFTVIVYLVEELVKNEGA